MTQADCSFSIWVLGANQAKRASNEQGASVEGFGFSQHLSDPAFSCIFSSCPLQLSLQSLENGVHTVVSSVAFSSGFSSSQLNSLYQFRPLETKDLISLALQPQEITQFITQPSFNSLLPLKIRRIVLLGLKVHDTPYLSLLNTVDRLWENSNLGSHSWDFLL